MATTKAPAKKPSLKKAVTKKPSPKKPVAKKPAPKKAVAKKPAVKKESVEIIAILDRSGSMAAQQAEVINGYNHYIQKQKELPGDAKASLTIFDHEITLVYGGIALPSVPALDSSVYFTRGMTALNDAVGQTLSAASARLKGKAKALVCIITDGQENASKEYTTKQIKKMIADLEKKGWEFAFIGVGIDAFNEADAIGVAKVNARGVSSVHCVQSVGVSFDAMTVQSSEFRSHHAKKAPAKKPKPNNKA